mgnify:FL=1
MTEYDNTNRGAAFQPRDTSKMVLEGKLNLEGNDRNIIIVSDTTQAGQKIMKMYQKVGAMFTNDKGDNENRPDFSGNMDDYATNKDMRVSAWTKEKDGKKWLSLSIEEKRGAAPLPNVNQLEDEIPF